MLKQGIYSTSIFNLEINFKKVHTLIQSFKQVIVYNVAAHIQRSAIQPIKMNSTKV